MNTSNNKFFIIFIAAVSLLLSSTAGFAQESPGIKDRSDATAIIEELRKIHTPEGIEVLEQVVLGGVPQWISIRGRNRDNPVLLFIHGGPGDPMIGLSWAFQNPWEDYFTVVQWDQRGSGKNTATADREALRGTFSLDRLVNDTEELVEHLRERLGKEKVVALGYSSGGILGIHLAKRRPDWLHAYIGVGQPSHDTRRAMYARTLELAIATSNNEAVKELESLGHKGVNWDDFDPAHFIIGKWMVKFNGGWYGKGGWDLYADLPKLAPEYTAGDVLAWGGAQPWLVSDGYFNIGARDLRDLGPRFQIPVFFFHGRYDLTPPIENVQAYIDWIEAPHKRLVIFERSAHIPFIEEPGRFFMALIEHILPLTEGTANFEPKR